MRAELLDIERVVPINHVLAHVVALLVVSSHPSVSVLLNVEGVCRVPRADHILESVALFEFQLVHGDKRLENALTSLILSHKLDELVDDPLEVLICLVSKLGVAVQVHEVLHSLTLGIACLADEGEEQQVSRQNLHVLIMQVNVQ